jgi:hypothetical protein
MGWRQSLSGYWGSGYQAVKPLLKVRQNIAANPSSHLPISRLFKCYQAGTSQTQFKTFDNNWFLGASMFVERASPFRAIIMCASKAFGESHVSNHCLSNNLPFF